MLPQKVIVTKTKQSPTRTYKIDWNTKHIVDYVEGEDAIKQAVDLYLSTERYQWVIYSWQYGSDLNTLIGKDMDYVQIEAQRMIMDALSVDNRITKVDNFKFDVNGRNLHCTFTINTLGYKIQSEFDFNA